MDGGRRGSQMLPEAPGGGRWGHAPMPGGPGGGFGERLHNACQTLSERSHSFR